jgi:hypothetical protein
MTETTDIDESISQLEGLGNDTKEKEGSAFKECSEGSEGSEGREAHRYTQQS